MAIVFDPDKGLSVETTAEIRQAIVDDWEAIFNDEEATLNTDNDSPAGQIIDSEAVLITAKDSVLLNLMNQFNPLTADGIFQDALGAIYYIVRKTAQPTVVTCQLTGLQGTVIPAGSIVQNTDGYKLKSVGAVTIPASGNAEVEFECVETGPIAIGANTCKKIVTVIAGWDTVNNSTAGVLGRDVEPRAEFEARRFASVAANSHGSRLALEGALKGVNGVVDCLVLENKKDTSETIQGVSLISHSVAICIYGGSNNDIAKTIYNKLDAGCGTNGNTIVQYISPEDDAMNEYAIVRPTATNIYIAVEINRVASTLTTVVDDIKNAIIADFNGLDNNSGNTRRGMGDTIYASSFTVAIVKTAGVADLVSVYIGRTSPASSNYVTMDADEEPIISAANISVTVND